MKAPLFLGSPQRQLAASTLTMLAAVSFLNVEAQELDPGFVPPLFWERFNDYTFSQGPYRSFADGQGGVYVVGNGGADVVSGNWYTEPIRLLITNAVVDTAFRSAVSGGFATAVQPDGRIVISRQSYATETVVRLMPSGALDPSFTPVGFDKGIRRLEVLPDGKILVVIWGNTFWTKHAASIAVPNPTILRLHTNGLVDASFRWTEFGESVALYAQPVADQEGRLYVGGSFTSVNGIARTNLVRLLANGEVDESFLGASTVPGGLGGTVREVALQSDGRLVVVGDLRIPPTASSANRIAAIRFTSDGRFDASFTTNKVSALGLTTYPREMVMCPDNRFVTVSSGLRRFNADGSRDFTFNEQNFSLPAYWISRLSDGRLMVPGGNPAEGLYVFTVDGTPDPSSTTGGFGRATPPVNYAFLDNGRIAVCGGFNRVGSQPQLGLALFNSDTGQTVPSQPPLGSLTASDAMSYYVAPGKVAGGASNTVWFLASVMDTNGHDRRLFGKVLETGVFDPAVPVQDWSSNGGDALHALPDGRLLVLDNSAQGAVDGSPLRRLLPNGQVDASFLGLAPELCAQLSKVTRNIYGYIASIEVGTLSILTQSGTSHMLASVNTIGGEARLVRLRLDGSQDSGFAPAIVSGLSCWLGFDTVFDPLLQEVTQPWDGALHYDQQVFLDAAELPNGGFLVCGQFHELNGLPVTNLVCLNSNGTVNPDFPTVSMECTQDQFEEPRLTSIEVDAQGRTYVAGVFDRINGVAAPGLARLLSNGTVDPTFKSPLNVLPELAVNLKLMGDYLYVFGSVTHGETRRMAWRLNVGMRLGYDHAAGASVVLLVPGDPNQPTVLQASDDLFGWADIFTNAIGAATVRFSDPAASVKTSRFYRLRQ